MIQPPEGLQLQLASLDDDGIVKNSTVSKYDDYNPNLESHPRMNLLNIEFYRHPKFIENLCEILFHIKRRNTTIQRELRFGLVQFVSCLYILPVVPIQMQPAGYSIIPTIVVTAAISGIGSIICGLFANLPFIVAPPTSVSIFLSVYLQENNLDPQNGNIAVVISGICLIFVGYRPLANFLFGLIPTSIQVGTAIGIGLITCLAGCTEINLVERGQYTILKMGAITSENVLALAGVAVVAVAVSRYVQGAFSIVLVMNTLLWWGSQNEWPSSIAETPSADYDISLKSFNNDTTFLILSLVFLYVVTVVGLVASFTDIAKIAFNSEGKAVAPRGERDSLYMQLHIHITHKYITHIRAITFQFILLKFLIRVPLLRSMDIHCKRPGYCVERSPEVLYTILSNSKM